MNNLKLEAELLFLYGWERHDLMKKGVRFQNDQYGKGLFARKQIPSQTVLAYYPGDRISEEEVNKRSMSRTETDRFVFTYYTLGGSKVS